MDKKMTMIIVIGFLIVGAFIAIKNVNGKASGYAVSEIEIENLYEVNLAIENMYCEACAYGVKAQIEELDGVVSADISYKDSSGVVKYNADLVDSKTIAEASTVYPASVTNEREI